MKDILEGLQILIKYDPEGDFAAEHDEVFCGGPPPDQLLPEEAARLLELRWRWDEILTSWKKFV